MEKIKAIFIDFDWTIFDHKVRDFNKKGIEGLIKAHEKGVKLIINSARSNYSLKGLNTFNLLPVDGKVVSNGGAAILDDKVLYADLFENNLKDEFLDLLNKNNYSYNLVTLENNYIKVTNKDIVHDFYEVYYEPFPLDISSYKNEEVLAFQVLCYEEDEKIIKEFSEKHNLVYNRFASNNVEITTKEFVKSKGIETIYNHLNLKKEEAMAFGDDLNDISMFHIVKYGICMGNGKDEAKKEAFYITGNIEDDGLYNALKHFEVID